MNTVSVTWPAAATKLIADLDFNLAEHTRSEPTFFEHSDDILAYVVAWQQQGKEPMDCYALIEKNVESNYIDASVELTPEIREEAATIRRHFQHAILMRSLKNDHVSKWMNAVTEMLASPNKINREHIKIIVTLPRFYKETKETEAIFADRTTIDVERPYVPQINEVFEFVGKVRRDSKSEKEFRYYFKNSKNEILAMFLQMNNPANSVWNYVLSKSNRIKINAPVSLGRQPGHDLVFYKLGFFYELSDADT